SLRRMTSAQISELSSEGVDFQLHSHAHNLVGDFLNSNRAALETVTNSSTLDMFAYPGVNVVDTELPGIHFAFTTQGRLATRDSRPTRIPRLCDNMTVGASKFALLASG